MIEYKIKISIEDENGKVLETESTSLYSENGKVAGEDNAEISFHRAVRHFREQAPVLEREYVIDNLTQEQEDKLQSKHAENYSGTDDDMSDNFENWLEDLSLEEINKIINK